MKCSYCGMTVPFGVAVILGNTDDGKVMRKRLITVDCPLCGSYIIDLGWHPAEAE